MAKIHVLAMTAHDGVNVLLHFNTPAGDNAVSTSWKDAALADGLVGNAAHPQADLAEKPSIESGDIVELQCTLEVNPEGMSVPDRQAALDLRADRAIAAWIDLQQDRLRYYGYSQGAVS